MNYDTRKQLKGINKMDDYTIEKDIPYRSGKRSSWPFKRMEIGDSVFIGTDEEKTATKIIRAAHSYAANSQDKAKFKTTATTEAGEKGVRIWRVE